MKIDFSQVDMKLVLYLLFMSINASGSTTFSRNYVIVVSVVTEALK